MVDRNKIKTSKVNHKEFIHQLINDHRILKSENNLRVYQHRAISYVLSSSS